MGGHGNLNGDIHVWDKKLKKKVGFLNSRSTISWEFAPDGKHILTAVLNPWLRVDNNFKVFNYNGDKIRFMDFSDN